MRGYFHQPGHRKGEHKIIRTTFRAAFYFAFIALLFSCEVVADSRNIGKFNISDEVRSELLQSVMNRSGLLEEKLRQAISEVAVDPESMVIDIDYSRLSYLIAGRFTSIDISIKRSAIDMLMIEKADFQFRDVILDIEALWRHRKLVAMPGGRVFLNAVILEDDLNEFLDVKSDVTGVKETMLRLEDGYLALSGRFRTIFFGMPVSVNVSSTGSFEIHEDGKRINFIPENVRVNRAALPGFARNRLVRTINPILDLTEQPLDMTLRKIAIQKGRLLIISPDDPQDK